METSNHRIPFTVLAMLFAIGWLSGQSTTSNGTPITLDGVLQRHVVVPQTAVQTLVFQNLIPGETYVLTTTDISNGCRPDLEALDTDSTQYDATAHLMEFTANASTLSFRLTYPCTWDAASTPSHYVSLVCKTCKKKDLQEYMAYLTSQDAESVSQSALAVQSGFSAEELIENVLFGGNCNISGVQFSGYPGQIGKFFQGQTNIGLTDGMVLATGDISVSVGPNDSDNASAGFGNSIYDDDLSTLSGSSATFDLANIEFDITPTQSPLTFEYVFASEEYCEYVGSAFNDAFGFFISGPGISGPFGGAANIAVVPNSSTYVAINNVNHLTNPGLYTNNTPANGTLCGQNPSFAQSVNEVQFDGFTHKLTATANVIPCQTYHVKLKICDIGDGIFDSAVFLKEGSVNDPGDVAIHWLLNGQPANEVFEGLGTVQLVFQRIGGNLNLQLPVYHQIQGTATPNFDYSNIPYPVIIPAGQTTVVYTVTIYNDLIAESQESIIVKSAPCACDNPMGTLIIQDYAPTYSLTTSVGSLNVCDVFSTSFEANLTSFLGFNSPVVLNVTGIPAGATVNISPNPVIPSGNATVFVSSFSSVLPGNYTLTITGVGGNITKTTTVLLSVLTGVSAPILVSPSDGKIGVSTGATLSWISVAGAVGYVVEVSRNPSFSILDYSITLAETSTTVGGIGLQPETVYYWRIKAFNDCGTGNYSTTYAFQTGINQCELGFGTFPGISINSNTINTVTNDTDVPFDYVINDVDVSLSIGHTNTGDLSAWLVSPYLDTIALFDRPGVPASGLGCTGDNVDLTFDMNGQSAVLLENMCNFSPPSLNGTFMPIGSLNVLNGKSMLGNWRIIVKDNRVQNGGILGSWFVSFCYATNLPSGSLLTNNTLYVNGGGSGFVGMPYLKMTTTGTANQGKFVVLKLPTNGSLYLNNALLGVGSTFTQADINNNSLVYVNNCNGQLSDNFRFDALDQNNNAWVHNAIFNISVLPSPLTATIYQTQYNPCFGDANGEISILVNLPNGNYTYSLNGGQPQSSNVFSNLSAGNYYVEVAESGGCSLGSTFLVTEPFPIQVTVSSIQHSVIVTASGGTGLLQYSINGGNFQSSNQFDNLCNGSYTVAVLDANGCIQTTQVTVNGPLLSGSFQAGPPIPCFGGSTTVSVIAVNGIAPIEYQLGNAPFQSNSNFNNVLAGTYTVKIKDACGTIQLPQSITITQPSQINVNVTTSGNDAFVNISGGTPPYVTTTNAPNPNLQNLPNGTYNVTVTDANMCVKSSTFTINVTISAATNVLDGTPCDGLANIEVTASNGTPPYEYSLNGIIYQSSNVFLNLPSGIYNVYVRDANNGAPIIVQATVNAQSAPTITVETIGDSIVVNATGGTPPYLYSLNVGPQQSNNVFPNLNPGTYTVAVAGANGCVALLTQVIILSAVEPSEAWGLTISPNPSSGLFDLTMTNAPDKLQADVFDGTGRLIRTLHFQAIGGQLAATIDLQDMPSGTYLLRLGDGKNWGGVRLIKVDRW